MQPSQPLSSREVLRRRFPQLSETELDEASLQIRLYVSFLLRLADSIASDPERYERFHALTDPEK